MLDTASLRRLLIVDPCDDCHRLLPDLLAAGWDVSTSALEQAREQPCDVGVLRLRAAHLRDPVAVKELIKRSDTEWIAVLSTEELRLHNVGDFVCEWFFDFHTLPFDAARVLVTLGRAYGMARLRGKSAPSLELPDDQLLGDSRPIRELRRLLGKLASADAPVLIRGESGTGKALVAKTLHRQSQRRSGPFVAVNCAAIPEHLLQAELFGQVPGAPADAHPRQIGRIEAAQGGTLFLGAISALPLGLQADLLRVLQEKHLESLAVDVRLLTATDSDLVQAVERGSFRDDLYRQLNALHVEIAPLRARHGDLALLADHFARFYGLETGRRPRSFSDSALAAMARHDWPGNVRELGHRVRRGLVLAEGRQIEAQDLGLEASAQDAQPLGTLEDYKHRAERQALRDVLDRHSNNFSLAARVLGVSRPTFYRLLRKHQMR
ncbi:sigma-54-dependent transcriptional regulator [Pseudomonas sp. MLB6B]